MVLVYDFFPSILDDKKKLIWTRFRRSKERGRREITAG